MGIEARTVTKDNATELAEWCGGRLVEERDSLDESKTSPGINVPVIHSGSPGVMRASVGDTIICRDDSTFTVNGSSHPFYSNDIHL